MIYVICPTCGVRRVLTGVPVAPWPICDDCNEMMQVYVPRAVMPRPDREAA